MKDNNKFKLGLFVCFSVILFIAAIAAFGIFERFREKVRVVTLFSDSVQGLSAGSALKYQGVPVGTVADIGILTEPHLIAVIMEVDLEKFRGPVNEKFKAPKMSAKEFGVFIREEVKRGLRCAMEMDGIAGGKYIEMKFYKDPEPSVVSIEEFYEAGPNGPNKELYVPGQPSQIMTLLDSFSSIANSLKKLDYQGLHDKLSNVLVEGSKLLEDGHKLLKNCNETLDSEPLVKIMDNVKSLTGHLDVMLKNANETITKDRLEGIMHELQETIQSIDKLSKNLESEVKDMGMNQVMKDFRMSMSRFVQSAKTFDETLSNVNNGIGALTELLQYLDKDPQALIKGKSLPALNSEKQE